MIYKSTMAQANQFMAILERINTVGMAIQVLDTIPNDQVELKATTKAEIIRLLLTKTIRGRLNFKTAKEAKPHTKKDLVES